MTASFDHEVEVKDMVLPWWIGIINAKLQKYKSPMLAACEAGATSMEERLIRN
jgi:hypothetical protein